ncbi:MAG: hypothetical protein Q9214_001723 [Letrouitia sp. 1 TL-2023]
MTVLLTGGTGKTAVRLAQNLADAQISCVLASRKGGTPVKNTSSCRFDWNESSSFNNPFEVSSDIDKVYLVAPVTLDPLAAMKPFIDFAKAKGVKRFVLLTASTIEAGGIFTGKVHEYLMGLGVEWSVVKPTWFMENLSELQHLPTIRDENKICSAAGEGKLPWVTAEDIAAVAFKLLVDKEPHNRDYVVYGPELLSYGQLAEILSEVLGRKIQHENYTEEQLAARYIKAGMPDSYAKMLSNLDTQVSNGLENKLNDVVENLTGRPPKTFKAFAEENKAVWK